MAPTHYKIAPKPVLVAVQVIKNLVYAAAIAAGLFAVHGLVSVVVTALGGTPEGM